MNRRDAARMLAASMALAAFPGLAREEAAPSRPLVKPRRLRAGDVVGLIAPSGVLEDAQIERGVRNLESLGLTVKLGGNIRAAHGGYAGTVQQRIEDLHGMFLDREVRGVWAARGGSGCSSLLPRIDYGIIRRNPKVLVGYSDITALHLALLRHAGLVTFHGPVSSSTFSGFSADRLREVLMEPQPRRVLHDARENLAKAIDQPQFAPRTFRAGRAEGRLLGGNLSVLCSLVGTDHLPRVGASLLFLEDIGEAPYRIERMLAQLGQARVLRDARGIAFGVFQKSQPEDEEPSLTLDETLEEQVAPLRIPVASAFSFGHIPHQLTLPLGVRARLDTEERTLTLLESPVAG